MRLLHLLEDNKLVSYGLLDEALKIVKGIYTKHGTDDKAAKGTEMVKDLKAELKTRFSKKPKK